MIETKICPKCGSRYKVYPKKKCVICKKTFVQKQLRIVTCTDETCRQTRADMMQAAWRRRHPDYYKTPNA